MTRARTECQLGRSSGFLTAKSVCTVLYEGGTPDKFWLWVNTQGLVDLNRYIKVYLQLCFSFSYKFILEVQVSAEQCWPRGGSGGGEIPRGR